MEGRKEEKKGGKQNEKPQPINPTSLPVFLPSAFLPSSLPAFLLLRLLRFHSLSVSSLQPLPSLFSLLTALSQITKEGSKREGTEARKRKSDPKERAKGRKELFAGGGRKVTMQARPARMASAPRLAMMRHTFFVREIMGVPKTSLTLGSYFPWISVTHLGLGTNILNYCPKSTSRFDDNDPVRKLRFQKRTMRFSSPLSSRSSERS